MRRYRQKRIFLFCITVWKNCAWSNKILNEWTNENKEYDIIASYQYVFEFGERLEETMRLVQKELRKSQSWYKQNEDKRAKKSVFKKEDEALVMLPTNNNKLLMQGQEPHKAVWNNKIIMWWIFWTRSSIMRICPNNIKTEGRKARRIHL